MQKLCLGFKFGELLGAAPEFGAIPRETLGYKVFVYVEAEVCADGDDLAVVLIPAKDCDVELVSYTGVVKRGACFGGEGLPIFGCVKPSESEFVKSAGFVHGERVAVVNAR